MTHEIYSYSLQQIDDLESKLIFDLFTTEIAWDLGNLARSLAQENYPRKSIIIDITLVGGQNLFHSAINSDTSIDNDYWVKRKYNTVFRFHKSSFYIGQKLRQKGKSLEDANFISSIDYATHGGSIPIKIRNFDGIIGALTISGLAQEEDHLLAIQSVKLFKEQSLNY
ncbi:unnamed protein product [Candida verbasci]|uniref:Uncharacterized protein n=1 Tax=Candida verbasci TaxID=1227364 RepID=A0A9W4TZH9_9ASCO|nr:unnamed protein product [Candida verbasci]